MMVMGALHVLQLLVLATGDIVVGGGNAANVLMLTLRCRFVLFLSLFLSFFQFVGLFSLRLRPTLSLCSLVTTVVTVVLIFRFSLLCVES